MSDDINVILMVIDLTKKPYDHLNKCRKYL